MKKVTRYVVITDIETNAQVGVVAFDIRENEEITDSLVANGVGRLSADYCWHEITKDEADAIFHQIKGKSSTMGVCCPVCLSASIIDADEDMSILDKAFSHLPDPTEVELTLCAKHSKSTNVGKMFLIKVTESDAPVAISRVDSEVFTLASGVTPPDTGWLEIGEDFSDDFDATVIAMKKNLIAHYDNDMTKIREFVKAHATCVEIREDGQRRLIESIEEHEEPAPTNVTLH